MNAPEESFTVPVSVAPATCAYARADIVRLTATANNIQRAETDVSLSSLSRIENLRRSRRSDPITTLTGLQIRTRDLHLGNVCKTHSGYNRACNTRPRNMSSEFANRRWTSPENV